MTQTNKIKLGGDIIRYGREGAELWELPLSSVRVIGEATTPNGPYLDDYSFCFACGPDSWYEASFYAGGGEEFLRSLGARLGFRPELQLVGSTDFASSVIWPAHLKGKPMFKYVPVVPRTWLGKLIGSMQYKQCFSEEVLGEFAAGV